MKRTKWLLPIFIGASLIFLIQYLIKFDYLILNNISFNYKLLSISIVLLWAGFTISALSWKIALKAHKVNINIQEALYSHGISTFGKYIPGKVWVILGRAAIVNKNHQEVNLIKTSSISLKEQLVYLLFGLIISLPVIKFVNYNPFYISIIIGTIISLSLFLFNKKIHTIFINLLKRIFNREIEIPYINLKETKNYAFAIITLWLLWSTGFFFFCKSIAPEITYISGFAYPISICFGLMAIIMPAGIGVREGIMVLILTSSGIDLSTATTISVLSRIWFITGEIFIFILALLSKPKKN